jgi:hypothetical protein
MTVSFAEHLALFDQFLSRRQEIVERIEQHLLNVQGKDTSRRRDRAHFDNLLSFCFFALPGLSPTQARLKGQLAARHLAEGFDPVPLDKYSHELDPLELIPRAYHHWERHRWPGRSGRLTYAQTIYTVFMLRQLEALSLRIWDDGTSRAAERIQELQRLLDRLNAPASPDVFVRDARWLIQTAQGTLTRYLPPYFKVADRIAASFTDEFRLGLRAAGVKLAGGHLRSQLRYRVWETGLAIDDPDILAVTRNSNSMDVALLVRDLAPLLEAYEAASAIGNDSVRLELADAILQGLSADPEICLTRLDLLGPLTTIEELFIARDADGVARYTPAGDAHVELLQRYRGLAGRLAAPLLRDAATFDPADREYSPFGIVYGFVADILSNMAHARLVGADSLGLSLEDTFESRHRLDTKLSRAQSWVKLPTKEGEREHFEHSPEWARQMFARLTRALDDRARRPDEPNASTVPSAHVFIAPAHPDRAVESVAAQEYCVTSDLALAESSRMTAEPINQIVRDRQEGRFLASAIVDGHWCGISKVVLSTVTSQGRDAILTGVPRPLESILRLTCPALVVLPSG